MKRGNLNDLLGDLEPHKPERQLRVNKDEGFEQTLEKLLTIYNEVTKESYNSLISISSYKPLVELNKIPDLKQFNITPQIIFALTNKIELPLSEFGSNSAAQYLTILIQQSYNAGHNNFELFFGRFESQLTGFGRDLAGQPDNPLRLRIIGDVGDTVFSDVYYVSATVEGSARYGFANRSHYSDFEVRGNVISCAEDSFKSTFKLLGNVDYVLDELHAIKCTFKHSSEAVLNIIRKNISETFSSSILYRIRHNSPFTFFETIKSYVKYKTNTNTYYLLKDGKEVPYTMLYRFKKQVGFVK